MTHRTHREPTLDDVLFALEHADADPEPGERSSLARDRDAFRARVDAAPVRPHHDPPARTGWLEVALAVAAVAALMVGGRSTQPVPDAVQTKGGTVVDAWRVGDTASALLAPRDRIRAGDTIQLTVSSAEASRVAVWSRDPSGAVVSWFGPDGTVVASGDQVVIDRSATFDAAAGEEHLAARVCPENGSVGADPWTQSADPEGCRSFVWRLEKQP